MKEIFAPQGILSEIIPSFEFRSEQEQMANFILERLYDSENGIIEAGTGIGKTLAYLVPAVLYAMEQDKKIAVSTETKALQRQLVEKDLPVVRQILQRHLNIEFSYSLCLGSSNYPCRKRFETGMKTGKFQPGELKKLKRVVDLFDGKKVFTRFDVSLPGYLWNEINREGDSCGSFRCPFAGACSYQLARKEWSQSQLLVMNHYLFFTNIASGKTYLPQCDLVIFDEAHSLEDVAASQLGFNLGYKEITDIINLFYNDKRRGLAGFLEDECMRQEWITSVKQIIPGIGSFFEGMRMHVASDKQYIRIREPVQSGSSLVELLKQFMILIADAEKIFDDENPNRIEFDIARGKLFTYLESLSSFVFQSNENYVYWIERESDALLGDLFLRGQPVDIADIFQREVATCYDSTVLVSATLAIDGDFTYTAGRLGMDRYQSLALKSSFDYQSQMVLYIARDIPDPGSPECIARSTSEAAEIIKHLRGNCLMLFTSYKMLRDVKRILEGAIEYPIHAQDVLTSTDAFARYVNDVNSVLMGTHSFWQGIDLPGDLVRGVIVMKLPFSVPDSPPVEAKMERLQALGKSPFAAFQVPEAVLRFKQGFGRLIRSGSDRGIVAVMDSRLITKSYGKIFLRAIPGCKIVHSLDELKEKYSLMCHA